MRSLVALGLVALHASSVVAAGRATLVADLNDSVTPCVRFSTYTGPIVEAGAFAYFGAHCNGGELWRADASGALLLGTFDYISSMVLLGDDLLFSAGDPVHGGELWISDGTIAGTTLLADINPGAASSGPERLFVAGGRVFFVADDGANGAELWQTDGTPGGTSLVLDIAAGAASSMPRKFFSTNGLALFSAFVGGTERLWRSDGTAAGTFELSSAAIYDTFEPFAVDAGGFAVFSAADPASGGEPWVTDGTVAGTFQLADIVAGPAYSTPYRFAAVAGRVVFTNASGPAGSELWATDGTVAGTAMIADIRSGGLGSHPSTFTAFGGFLYFAADDGSAGNEMWRTDGTPAGTTLFADLLPGAIGAQPSNFVVSGGILYFAAYDPAAGYEPWRSDGSVGGTFRIADILPGSSPSVRPYPSLDTPIQLTAQNGLAFFNADDGVHDFEVWRSDGSPAGTFSPLDTAPADATGFPNIAARVDGGILFVAVHASGTGTTLWFTDGTTAGTVVVAESPGSNSISSDPMEFTDLGGVAYFSAYAFAHGRELWRSDGTEAGTSLVKEIAPGTAGGGPSGLTTFAGKLYFSADDGSSGGELWRSDGSESGTVLFADIEPGAGSSFPRSLTRAGGYLFFTAETAAAGRELWATDGVSATQLADINPGSAGSDPVDLVELAGKLYFFADLGGSRELWTSDGTPGGTALVVATDGSGLVHNSSALFFTASDPAHGIELWTSDGTPGGTMILADVNPGPASSSPDHLTVVDETLYFGATEPVTGHELWVSDGISASLVADVTPGPTGTAISARGGAGGRFYFENVNGGSVWVSDGTASGTVQLNGLTQSGPVIDAGGSALFRSDSSSAPSAPWRSGGSRATTWRIPLFYESTASDPSDFAVVGQNVFFAATDTGHGTEPWVVSLAHISGCGPIDVACTPAAAGGAKLLLRDHADDGRDRFRLVLRSSVFGGSSLGTYAICIYDHTLGLPSLAMQAVVPEIPVPSLCDGAACWRQGGSSVVFRDPTLSRAGIRRMSLTTPGGKPKIVVAGRGLNLPLPAPAPMSLLRQDPEVTVQVKTPQGSCWGADFSAPAARNTMALFRDTSD